MIHTGELIEHTLRQQGRQVQWLADKLHCHRTNCYKIFLKSSIDTSQLHAIGIAMGINFFQLLADDTRKDYSSSVQE